MHIFLKNLKNMFSPFSFSGNLKWNQHRSIVVEQNEDRCECLVSNILLDFCGNRIGDVLIFQGYLT